MPRKIRELKAQIAREGFICPNVGHPLLGKTMTIPGKNGDDVPPYLEKQLAQLLAQLEDFNEDED